MAAPDHHSFTQPNNSALGYSRQGSQVASSRSRPAARFDSLSRLTGLSLRQRYLPRGEYHFERRYITLHNKQYVPTPIDRPRARARGSA